MENNLTSEWLLEQGFIRYMYKHGDECYYKNGINIELDFDGWYLRDKDERYEHKYFLSTKPFNKKQVELLHVALNGTLLNGEMIRNFDDLEFIA